MASQTRASALAARLRPPDDRKEMINGEKVLVARRSAFNEILLTENASGLRTLCFGSGGAFQSIVKAGDPRHLELPYARILPACLAFVQDPRRMLIVGLGGGTLPRFFHSRFPQMMIDVVEIDQEVVDVAKAYCGFDEDARMRVDVSDGRDFIEESPGGYDMIILDSFDTDSIPPHLTTVEFLGGVRKALAPEGIAVGNVWGRTSNPLYAHMLTTYRAAFEDVYIFDVPAAGTKIFAALPRRQAMTREEVISRAREISGHRGFDYDLGSAVAGFRNAGLETVHGGSVLRD